MTAHILDRPVWATLTGRQGHLAVRHGAAIRMSPDHGLFAAIPDNSAESLAALGELVREMGPVGLVEPAGPPPIPGTEVVSSAVCLQMVAETVAAGWDAPFDMLPLADAAGLDHGLAYQALAKGQVDLIDVYSTDAQIGRLGVGLDNIDVAAAERAGLQAQSCACGLPKGAADAAPHCACKSRQPAAPSCCRVWILAS